VAHFAGLGRLSNVTDHTLKSVTAMDQTPSLDRGRDLLKEMSDAADSATSDPIGDSITPGLRPRPPPARATTCGPRLDIDSSTHSSHCAAEGREFRLDRQLQEEP